MDNFYRSRFEETFALIGLDDIELETDDSGEYKRITTCLMYKAFVSGFRKGFGEATKKEQEGK